MYQLNCLSNHIYEYVKLYYFPCIQITSVMFIRKGHFELYILNLEKNFKFIVNLI